MKEELAILRENVYAGREEGFIMSEGTAEGGGREGGRRPIVDRTRITDEAKARSEEQKVEAGIAEFSDEERTQTSLARVRGQLAQSGGRPSRPPEGRPADGEARARPAAEYFPQTPPAPELAQAAENFRYEAEGKTLAEVDTKILTKHYLKLKTLADALGTDTGFLSKIQNELSGRGINLNQVERLGNVVRRGVRGAQLQIDMTGITNPKLLQEARAINSRLGTYEDEEVAEKIEYLRKSIEDIGRVDVADERQRELVRQRIRDQLTPLVQQERQKRERERTRTEERERAYEERERTGLYLERKLTTDDKIRIEEEIDRVAGAGENAPLEGEHIARLFNRMFDQADNNPGREFTRDAFGTKGEFEQRLFNEALNEIADKATTEQTRAIRAGDREAASRAQKKHDVVRKFIEKYSNEFEMRQLLHNAYYIAETEGDFEQFANYCKQFASRYADVAFKDAPEVEAALRIRERVLYELREKHGFIRPEYVTYNPDKQGSVWETRTSELLEGLNRKGLFKRPGKDVLEPWQMARAMTISRGLGMVFLRFPEIVAEQPLSAPSETSQAWFSPPWEKIVWELNMLDYKAKKYAFGNRARAILYASLKRKSKGLFDFWDQNELKNAVNQDAIGVLGSIHGGEKRIIDMRNLFRTGGPFTHTGWRPYVAALEEDRSGLRQLLQQNPGLAMRMIYNRYEVLDQNIKKYELFKNENLSPDEKLHRWEEIQRLGKIKGKGGRDGGGIASWGDAIGEAKAVWGNREREFWMAASKRIPHVIWRIITDPANGILTKDEVRNLTGEVSRAIGVGLTSGLDGILVQLGEDLTFAKEGIMRRRKDKIAEGGDAAWTEQLDQLTADDFSLIDDEQRRDRAQRFKEVIASIMSGSGNFAKTQEKINGKILDLIKDREFSFALTAEDVPWSEFAFGQTGNRGYFTRKINDSFSVSKANASLEKYLKSFGMLKSPEEYIAMLKEIYTGAEEYDQNRARDAIKLLAIGTIRFMQKDGILKVPVFGEILGILNKIGGKGGSYAETVFGGRMGAWDADDIYHFTEQLRQISLTAEEVQEIRKETGGQWWQAFMQKSKLALYLLFLFGSYEMLQRILAGEKQ